MEGIIGNLPSSVNEEVICEVLQGLTSLPGDAMLILVLERFLETALPFISSI